jgi:hypothetical protein
MKRLLVICFSLILLSCGGCWKEHKAVIAPPDIVVVDPKAQVEKEVVALFQTMEQSWNEKNWTVFNNVWSKNLVATFVRASDGTVTTWDYNEYTTRAPERRDRIGVMYVSKVTILDFTDLQAKVMVTEERGRVPNTNIFNLAKEDGTWRIISNDYKNP